MKKFKVPLFREGGEAGVWEAIAVTLAEIMAYSGHSASIAPSFAPTWRQRAEKRMARPVSERFVSDVLNSLRKHIRPRHKSLAKMEIRAARSLKGAASSAIFHHRVPGHRSTVRASFTHLTQTSSSPRWARRPILFRRLMQPHHKCARDAKALTRYGSSWRPVHHGGVVMRTCQPAA